MFYLKATYTRKLIVRCSVEIAVYQLVYCVLQLLTKKTHDITPLGEIIDNRKQQIIGD